MNFIYLGIFNLAHRSFFLIYCFDTELSYESDGGIKQQCNSPNYFPSLSLLSDNHVEVIYQQNILDL